MLNSYLLMSLLGYKISFTNAIRIFGDYDLNVFNNLITKRFIKYSDTNHFIFYHENIYKYFKTLFHNESNINRYSTKIHNNYNYLLKLLDPFKQGEIAYYANDYELAKKHLLPIYQEVNKVKNYSSNQLDSSYISYMDTLFNLMKDLNENTQELQKIRICHIYLLIHNRPLITAIKKCSETLNDHCLSKNKIFLFEIKQLKAHTLLNMGRLQQSKKIMYELIAESLLRKNIQKLQPIKFDLYDRLAGLYLRYNHASLSEKFNLLSYKLTKQINDPDQLALCKITESKLYMYKNTSKSWDLLNEAKNISKSTKAQRIECHAKVGLIICKLLMNSRSTEELSKLLLECDKELKFALKKNYSHTITRCYLIKATIYSYQRLFEKSDYFINRGIISSIRFGTGIFVWQLYNLKAINGLNKGLDYDIINKYFLAAIDYLKRQDLLFFGDFDFTSPNQILITNYIMFLIEFKSDQQIFDFINQIRYYDFDISKFNDNAMKLLDSVKNKKIVSINKNLVYNLKESDKKFYYCVS